MNNDNYENQAGALGIINARIETLENLRDVHYSEIINDATRRAGSDCIVLLANALSETENTINELYILQSKIRRANTEVTES